MRALNIEERSGAIKRYVDYMQQRVMKEDECQILFLVKEEVLSIEKLLSKGKKTEERANSELDGLHEILLRFGPFNENMYAPS